MQKLSRVTRSIAMPWWFDRESAVFGLKWAASIIQIMGYSATAFGLTPLNIYLFLIGLMGWFVEGPRHHADPYRCAGGDVSGFGKQLGRLSQFGNELRQFWIHACWKLSSKTP
jgi:hypothetical protein